MKEIETILARMTTNEKVALVSGTDFITVPGRTLPLLQAVR